MSRVKSGKVTRKRHKKILRLAKGYYGAKSKLFRVANQAVMKSLNYAYIGRKLRKRDFRKLWIARINAAARANGISYSRFINGLKKANIEINRKMLSEMAISDGKAFSELVDIAKQQLNA
ncbi:50S ribosomal protein L20 [Aceticella autotrophica]|jgi:large subunit ribosomal protein L20|uniref:Large ribosomal subunit protein bL20 n=1 Tax=Aceticella autotrophica TaxID=2755338 RepID=A0A975AWW7_9THEO|nr:50S ribosomal protein L20 [Aceticella autotrophica]MDI6604546.1 50S ribosomal protein L20 [Thermoanaerobacteraceae bacterium]QSZ27891.1 50S ribosomal protein L20 [Aceticella autotrophica]